MQTPEPIAGLNFTALDFEIANNHHRSACSLGLVQVKDGQIVHQQHWYIKPDPFEMGFFQHRVHGIHLEYLSSQPTFAQLWPEVYPYLANQVLVAHNMSFENSVLSKLCDHFDLDIEYLDDFCTYKAGPHCWPELASHKLSDLCTHLSIALNHHDALSDSLACALIAIEISRMHQGAPLHELAFSKSRKSTQPHPSDFDYEYQISRREHDNSSFRGKPLAVADLSGITWHQPTSETWTWANKKAVITGTFAFYPDRAIIARIIQERGGKIISGINGSTNLVIIGRGAGPSKIEKIKKLMDQGQSILLLNEEALLQILTKS